MEFKITFNLTAVRSFFEGEDAVGVRLRIHDDQVEFRPVDHLNDEDSAPLADRDRGGLAVIINGPEGADLLRHLKVSSSRPYFLLSKRKDGWITFQTFSGAKEPSRMVAYARIWLGSAFKPEIVSVDDKRDREYQSKVIRAKKLLDDYYQQPRMGRPPAEVAEAKDVIADFTRFAFDIIPLGEVHSAFDSLSRFLNKSATQVKPPVAKDTPKEDVTATGPRVDDELVVREPLDDREPVRRLKERA